MKDLKFKCIIPTWAEAKPLIKALKRIGINTRLELHGKKGIIINYYGGSCIGYSLLSHVVNNTKHSFYETNMPIVTLKEAMKMIAQVKPEFDIKLRDEVLIRDDERFWGLADFAYCIDNYFAVKGGRSYEQAIKATPESLELLGTTETPDEWWEAENGKPILRRKEK